MSQLITVDTKYSADQLRATFNHVWTLSPLDRDKLDFYALVKTTAGELLSKIDTNHSFIDYLSYPSRFGRLTCRVNYINGSTSYLEELIDTGKESEIVLVSFRIARVEWKNKSDIGPGVINTTKVALVLIAPDNIDVERLKCYSLDGREIV